MNELYNMLRKNFGDYEIINSGFLEGEKYGLLYIFPKNWLLNDEENRPILSYALEWDKQDYLGLRHGIVKKDENIPYKGKCPEEFKELVEIQESLKDRGFHTEDNYWLVWKWFKQHFSGMWQKEFYNEVLNSNIEHVIANYIDEINFLIERTKSRLDEFIKKYNSNTTIS